MIDIKIVTKLRYIIILTKKIYKNREKDMRVMILLAHGSRRKESALEIEAMAAELQMLAQKKGQFDAVKPAFMQFCGPDFYKVVDGLIQNSQSDKNQNLSGDAKQLKEVVVLPYFISAGSHVSDDIPEILVKAREKYPDISFKVTPHMGKFQGLKQLIIEETV